MYPMSSQAVAAGSTREGALTDLAVYRVIAEAGAWRIDERGVCRGRFSTLDEALSTARRLARDCAAQGTPACVQHDREAGEALGDVYGGAFQEWLQARRPLPGRPVGRPVGRPLGWA
jgi:hypothetical protein